MILVDWSRRDYRLLETQDQYQDEPLLPDVEGAEAVEDEDVSLNIVLVVKSNEKSTCLCAQTW